LDEIHVDTVGPIEPADANGNRYLFLLTDARTRYCWAVRGSSKAHGPAVIQQFITEIKNAYGKIPKMWFSDGGGEYNNHELTQMAQDLGMRWDLSAPHTPEQNGTAEAANKVILARARAMMIDAGFPLPL
jgi:transposase InsO family protein